MPRARGTPSVSHLENVCLQDVVTQLHGLLAVQLALLSREHECQESVPIPGARNTETCNTRPRTTGPQGRTSPHKPCNPSTSASPPKTVESCLFTKDGRCCLFFKLLKGFLGIPLPPWSHPEGSPRSGQVFISGTIHSLSSPYLSQKCKVHETRSLV